MESESDYITLSSPIYLHRRFQKKNKIDNALALCKVMVTARMLKVRGFIWMLAYKENYVLSASKPGEERLAQHQRHRFKYLTCGRICSRSG